EIGVAAVTISNYCRTKDELLDGRLEEASDRSLPEDAWEGQWQEVLRRYAHRLCEQAVQQLILVAHIVVDRHRLDPELCAESAHRQRLHPLAIDDSQRLGQHLRSREPHTPATRARDLLTAHTA